MKKNKKGKKPRDWFMLSIVIGLGGLVGGSVALMVLLKLGALNWL